MELIVVVVAVGAGGVELEVEVGLEVVVVLIGGVEAVIGIVGVRIVGGKKTVVT